MRQLAADAVGYLFRHVSQSGLKSGVQTLLAEQALQPSSGQYTCWSAFLPDDDQYCLMMTITLHSVCTAASALVCKSSAAAKSALCSCHQPVSSSSSSFASGKHRQLTPLNLFKCKSLTVSSLLLLSALSISVISTSNLMHGKGLSEVSQEPA